MKVTRARMEASVLTGLQTMCAIAMDLLEPIVKQVTNINIISNRCI